MRLQNISGGDGDGVGSVIQNVTKDPNTWPQFSPTTRTSRISRQLRNWTDDKQDGISLSPNTTSSLSMCLESRWFNPMHYHDDLIYALTKTPITKTKYYSQTPCLSDSSTPNSEIWLQPTNDMTWSSSKPYGPCEVANDYQWTQKSMTGPLKMALYSTKTSAMYLTTWTYDEKYWKNIMTLYQLDTLDNYALRKSYKETTGGLAHLSRTMLMDVPRASNTRSIDTCQTCPCNWSKRKIPAHFC